MIFDFYNEDGTVNVLDLKYFILSQVSKPLPDNSLVRMSWDLTQKLVIEEINEDL